MTTQESLFCNSFSGLFFNQSICETPNKVNVKNEKKDIAVDYQIALLIKKGIPFEVLDGRLFDKELVYTVGDTKIRNPFNCN